VPGMFLILEGGSPSANLMEVKASEAQGRHREVRSEGSVEQRCEATHRNEIEGAKAGRGSVRSQSPYPSRAGRVNLALVHRKSRNLPREACAVPWEVACHGNWLRGEQSALIAAQESAKGIVGAGGY
jgi:hypothetical protein